MSLPPELRTRVLAAAAAAPSPTRAQTITARFWSFGVAIAGALAIFSFEGRAVGVRMTHRPLALVAVTRLGTALIAAGGVYLLFTSASRSMVRRPWSWLLGASLTSTFGFLAWRAGLTASLGLDRPLPVSFAVRCLGLGVATGALPLAAALLCWRRTEPTTPAGMGAAFGAGAGLGSVVLADLWCPISYLPHLLVGHVLPIAILASLGALLGWRILRVRRR